MGTDLHHLTVMISPRSTMLMFLLLSPCFPACEMNEEDVALDFSAASTGIELLLDKFVAPPREVYASPLAYWTNAQFEPYVTVDIWDLNFEAATVPNIKVSQSASGVVNQSIVIPASVLAHAGRVIDVEVTFWDYDDLGVESTHDFIFSKKLKISVDTPCGTATGNGQGAQLAFRYRSRAAGPCDSPL